jgi:hypothetical protein
VIVISEEYTVAADPWDDIAGMMLRGGANA